MPNECNRPAKIGDWINVISASGHGNGIGIFEVTGVSDYSDGWVYVNGKTFGIITEDQYVVLED